VIQKVDTHGVQNAGPWKNPVSENLWFRRRVPANLLAFMDKREVKFLLGTADPELAK
jgi:hypothetical protein